MNRNLRALAIGLALVLLLPLSLVICEISLPDYYGESYYAQLPALYERLYETEGKKLVLIGGSNVAFGTDTELLEETLAAQGYDYTVCPFGLYAAVGTNAMLDLAQDALSDGDIVVLAIEPTSETLSTYFGATAFWKCCESTPEMLAHLSKDKLSSMAGNYIPYLQERFAVRASGNLPAADGVYAKASFDENGNMTYDRAGNTMTLGFDTATPVDLGAVSIAPDFAEQFNEFCAQAQRVGAQVFFSFSPVNRSALVDKTDLQGYFDLCNQTFNCPVISDPGDYVLESGWFYDNNFHLNSAGAIVRTYRLAQDLLAQLGCYQPLECEMPEMPASIAQVEANTADESHFLYEALGEGWLISGLTETGRMQTALTTPSVHEGKPVVGFTADGLSGASQLQELTLSGSIAALPDGLFSGCSALERLILQHTDRLCSIGEHPFEGAEHLKIFVPAESYPLYRDGDGCEVNPWSVYLSRIYVYG